jgi:hypothetical protein
LKAFGKLVRSADVIHGYENNSIIYEWSRDNAYLAIDAVEYKGIEGAILYYHNPPVHQIGTTALYAFHEALDRWATSM